MNFDLEISNLCLIKKGSDDEISMKHRKGLYQHPKVKFWNENDGFRSLGQLLSLVVAIGSQRLSLKVKIVLKNQM